MTLFVDGVEVEAVGPSSLEVDLRGVDVSQVITELTSEALLAEMDIDEIYDFIKEYEEDLEGSDE